MGVDHIVATAKQNLGITLARQGQLEEARRLLVESIEEFREHHDPRMEGSSRVYLAAILRDGGDLSAAEDEVRQALPLLTVVPSVRAEALGILASIRVAQGRLGEARRDAEEARRLADELGGLEDGEATVDLALAEALAASGDQDGAKKVLREARARLLARADKIASQAWRDSYLLRVPDHARALALWAEWNQE
jgi:ATP/maltotriose-dependent transcriptional regulator MalT